MWRFLSHCAAAALVLFAGPDARGSRVFAALEEFDRFGSREIWPGFEPRGIPLEIFDGSRTWLVRHPAPPPEFKASSGRADIRVVEGRHASMRSNTSLELAGVPTATASFEGRSEDAPHLAALLLHEAFHVFQARRHPKWGGNEVDLFLYPVEDAEALGLRRLESAALRRALAAGNGPGAAAWAARALELRRERFRLLPESAAAYERGSELKEGLAQYIEAETAGHGSVLFPPAEFPPAAIRDRAYASGCAIALLLDRLDPAWKRRLEEKDDVALDELLGRAVSGVSPEDFRPGETEEAAQRARQDVAAEVARRASLRKEFLEAPGWKLVVETEDRLFPQNFDPLNVERLSSSEVLHTRWVKLGNSSGALEVLDRRCLTESAGKHPLFEGIRRATVTGLPSAPRIEESDGLVKISEKGLTLEFRGARVSRSDHTVTITLGAPKAQTPRKREATFLQHAFDNGVQRWARPHRFGRFCRVRLIVAAQVYGSTLGAEQLGVDPGLVGREIPGHRGEPGLELRIPGLLGQGLAQYRAR